MSALERVDILLCRRIVVKGGGIHLAYVGHAVHADTPFPFTLRRVAVYVQVRGRAPSGSMFVQVVSPEGGVIATDHLPRPSTDMSGIGETWIEATAVAFPKPGLYSVRVFAGDTLLGDTFLLVLP
jgi:hypothetical protein